MLPGCFDLHLGKPCDCDSNCDQKENSTIGPSFNSTSSATFSVHLAPSFLTCSVSSSRTMAKRRHFGFALPILDIYLGEVHFRRTRRPGFRWPSHLTFVFRTGDRSVTFASIWNHCISSG